MSNLAECIQELRALEAMVFGAFFQARYLLKESVRDRFMYECIPCESILKYRAAS